MSVEEAEEAEPDDEFKDAIEVNTLLSILIYTMAKLGFLGMLLITEGITKDIFIFV